MVSYEAQRRDYVVAVAKLSGGGSDLGEIGQSDLEDYAFLRFQTAARSGYLLGFGYCQRAASNTRLGCEGGKSEIQLNWVWTCVADFDFRNCGFRVLVDRHP